MHEKHPFTKDACVPFKTFTSDELEAAIDEIGHGFGSNYTLTFC